METLSVTVTENVSPEVVERLRAKWPCDIPLDKPKNYVRLSQGQLAPLIYILGFVATWTSIQVGKGFFEEIGKRSARKVCDWARVLLKSEEGASIRSIAEALAEARNSLGEDGTIVVGLNTPHEFWGTTIEITDSNVDDISLSVASFILASPDIQAAVACQLELGKNPLNGVRIVLEDVDGGRIKLCWFDVRGRTNQEVEVEFTGACEASLKNSSENL